jgi:GrpB-like predicted nucleotidyltransferase (UPF0157 family)
MALAMTQDAPPLPIVIADYDPRWPAIYAEEGARIQETAGEWLLGMEHVGSTSVPGLAAKPVVDIMPGLRALSDAPGVIAAMEELGYQYIPDYEDDLPERRFFVRPPGPANRHRRLFHVHAVETTTAFWRRHLAFRDYLRAHPDVAAEYADLKRRLAAEHGSDRESYTEAKTGFITRIESLALAGEAG